MEQEPQPNLIINLVQGEKCGCHTAFYACEDMWVALNKQSMLDISWEELDVPKRIRLGPVCMSLFRRILGALQGHHVSEAPSIIRNLFDGEIVEEFYTDD